MNERLVLLVTLICLSVRETIGAEPLVTVLQGQLQGKTMTSRSGRSFNAFLGVPFAEPPVGELRFRGPKVPKPWNGIFNASQDGPMCLQKNYLLTNPTVEGQEDCLYLNIYTPELKPKRLLPVMVYIHGGGFFSGTGASYLWGPQYLLDKDIVLVTFNYRLGPLGFLSTGDRAASGNFGFKDQVAALLWVQNNIAQLGGNPGCVTIFGQSAGGSSVHLHMLSPLSAGLFHQAISQSGTALNAFAWPVDSISIAKRQAVFVGCDPDATTTAMIKCLRQVDGKTLLESGDKFKFWSIDPLDVFGPAIEEGPGAFLTADPFQLIKTGQFNHVPWLTGVVSDEGIIRAPAIITNKTLLDDLNKRFSILGPRLFEINKSVNGADEMVDYVWDRVVQFYMNGQMKITPETQQGFLNMYTDRSFIHPFHKSAKLHQQVGHHGLYLYHFNYRGLYSFSAIFANTTQDFGISHCDDLFYLFQFFPDWPADHPDRSISDTLINIWTNFATNGYPSIDSNQIIWEPVSPGIHLNYLEISEGPNLTMKQDLFQKRMTFWDSLPLIENDPGISGTHRFVDLMYNLILYLMD